MDQTYLSLFCKECDYPHEAQAELLRVATAIKNDAGMYGIFCSGLDSYNKSHTIETITDAFKRIAEAAEKFPENRETVEFLFFVFCTEHLKELYQQQGYDIKYYNGVLVDLRCKLFECQKVKGIWGSFVCNWFIPFFASERLAIGRLQYEITTLSPCASPDGKHIFSSRKAINIHIPSSGPLKADEVQASMREAAKVYKNEFSDGQILFICHSWLLYPGHFHMLGSNTGIRKFMDEFEIIRVDISEKENDLWRIFNTFEIADIKNLPEQTTLQRAYKQWLTDGKPVGAALGIKVWKQI